MLEMKNIKKNFGGVEALKGVDLKVGQGEIHGLLGENGAGKSTLMNILAGTYDLSEGKIYFLGENIKEMTTEKSQMLGIRFVHQELNVINDLRVYENLFLGEELTTSLGFLDKSKMIEKAKEVLKKIEMDVSPLEEVGNLDTSRKQLLEIGKALLFDAKLIIMDEPTTALTNHEIEMLFRIMRKLKSQDVSIIYISHKMPELFEICDKYTVLRDGKFIQTGDFKDIDENIATELLVGRNIINEVINKEEVGTDVLLEVSNISYLEKYKNLSFNLRRGEVLAITGLHGDGRDFLSESLYGVKKITSGEVKLSNKIINYKNIKETIQSGIGMVQRDRKERSLIKDMSILDNFSIGGFLTDDSHFVDAGCEIEKFNRRKKEMSIKIGHHDDNITSLSGGNQQKIMIARCLELGTEVIILDNPTQGIDVGAKLEVYKIINELAKKGRGIILFTSEYPEIYKVADRCLVMYKGEITKEFSRADFDEARIMYYSTGGKV